MGGARIPEPDFFDASLISQGNTSMFDTGVPDPSSLFHERKKTSGTFNNASEFTKPSGGSPGHRKNSQITSDLGRINNITIEEGIEWIIK